MSESLKNNQNGINGNTIKVIAIVAMLIDHIGWAFVPFDSVLGQIMHIIGRITAPTMCYFIAEGYIHTKNIKKYATRLGIFALISHIPFVFFETGRIGILFPSGVIYTLFLSLLSIWAYDKINNKGLKILAILGLCILAIPGDWSFIAIFMTLAFYINRGKFKKQCLWLCIISVVFVFIFGISAYQYGRPIYTQFFQFGILLSLPIIYFYNGERGKKTALTKWGFYIFYPLHLVILGLIKIYIYFYM